LVDDALMTLRRFITLALPLVVFALLVAGCGGGTGAGGSTADTAGSAAGSVPASAALAPADATAFVTLNTDVDSTTWADTGALIDLIPGARKALDSGIADFERNEKLSWKTDVRPLLGPELIVVVTKGNDPVVLMQPKDADAARKLIAKQTTTGSPTVTGDMDGWMVVAETQAVIDGYKAAVGQSALADNAGFASAMAAVPDTALARAYVSGSNLMSSVRNLASVSAAGAGDQLSLESMTMAVVPEKAGILISAKVKTPAGSGGGGYEPKLLARVPADAVAALSFGSSDKTFDDVRKSLSLDDAADGIEEITGVSLDGLFGLFSGEGMVYVREGAAIPEVTVVLAPPDVEKAFTDVDTLVRKIAKSMEIEVETVDQDGLSVNRIDSGDVNVSYARVDDAVVLTTGASGIRLFREDGDKLGASEAFRRAADKVGLGDRTAGFFYVDVDGLIPLVEGLADTADQTLPGEVRDAMKAFDSVMLVGSAGEDGTTTLSGFVAMTEK
jgi:Protein of unknown function (DUF3352)